MKNNYLDNKKRREIVPNFIKIIEGDYLEDDIVTERIIKIYEQYVFNADLNNEEEIKNLRKLDKIIYSYLEDNNLNKELKKSILNLEIKNDIKNVLHFIVNKIIEVFDSYVEFATRRIQVSRWI